MALALLLLLSLAGVQSTSAWVYIGCYFNSNGAAGIGDGFARILDLQQSNSTKAVG